jgi:hypothetical protein
MESRGEAEETMTNPGGTGTTGGTAQNRLDLASENNDTLVEGGTDSSDTVSGCGKFYFAKKFHEKL